MRLNDNRRGHSAVNVGAGLLLAAFVVTLIALTIAFVVPVLMRSPT